MLVLALRNSKIDAGGKDFSVGHHAAKTLANHYPATIKRGMAYYSLR